MPSTEQQTITREPEAVSQACSDEFSSEIVGNLEAIDQCKSLLLSLSDAEYSRLLKPYAQSSIGEHVRHVLDIYHALRSASDNLIDYNKKRRGSELETSRTDALAEIGDTRHWLQHLSDDYLTQSCIVRSELTLHEQSITDIPSYIRRELAFAASHVIHHCALIRICVRLSDLPTDELLGVAPATATYWRENKKLPETAEN